MPKYFRRRQYGDIEEMDLPTWVKGIRSEFIIGEGYYEYLFLQLGRGDKMIGSNHMYWMEWT